MIAGKAGAYPRVENLKGSSLGQAPTLPANIRLGWKGLPGTNTLAYYENYGRKMFYSTGPSWACNKNISRP
jgi:hypothetical protein